MVRYEDEYARVVVGVDRMVATMAWNLLDEAGIPSLLHGPDYDVAELGLFAHASVRGVDVLVRRDDEERAREVLRAAWGDGVETERR